MLKSLSIEKFFLLTALIFGILYVFILPPFQSVDEGMHFYRTYQISEGKFLAENVNGITGDELPVSLSNFYNMYTPFIKNIDKKSDMEILRLIIFTIIILILISSELSLLHRFYNITPNLYYKI